MNLGHHPYEAKLRTRLIFLKNGKMVRFEVAGKWNKGTHTVGTI